MPWNVRTQQQWTTVCSPYWRGFSIVNMGKIVYLLHLPSQNKSVRHILLSTANNDKHRTKINILCRHHTFLILPSSTTSPHPIKYTKFKWKQLCVLRKRTQSHSDFHDSRWFERNLSGYSKYLYQLFGRLKFMFPISCNSTL